VSAGAPNAAGNPAGYRRSDNVNAVVYRGSNGHIYELYLGATGWSFGDLSVSAGAPNAAGNPAGYRRSDNVNAVVYRGSNGHIYELYLVPGAPGWSVGQISP
jgi:hypothetical protein